MKVKIKTGFWKTGKYLLTVEENMLLFCLDNDKWSISFSWFVRLALISLSENPERFTMETGNGCCGSVSGNSCNIRKMAERLGKLGSKT